jgi:hypothetical protein
MEGFKKDVGVLIRYMNGDFDIDFGNGRTLGKLDIGRPFEAKINGVWRWTRILYHDTYDCFYLERYGAIPFGLLVRI